ncbi:MAG: repeat containing protein, partial [Phycisphaerales bacterium]|nr:repeat containing protein [Phycisphaerales bacterium]
NDPSGLARGPDGALYLCDTANHAVRRIAADGTITTVAGDGTRGYAGDGGPAAKAKLNEPYEVRFDPAGNLVVVERLNHCVRRVDAKTGVITTVAGTGKAGFSGDGGPATAAAFNEPHSIAFDKAGTLYVCDVKNHRLRRVDTKTGVVTTLAGTGQKKPTPDGARFADAPLAGPRAVDIDPAGNLWLALREGNAVYRLDVAAGTVHHVAGTGKTGYAGDGGPAKLATLAGPKGVSVGPDGRVYVADTENHAIRVIDPNAGTIATLCGTGTKGDGPDGPESRKCQLARPHGVFADADEALYIGDSENHRVRVLR